MKRNADGRRREARQVLGSYLQRHNVGLGHLLLQTVEEVLQTVDRRDRRTAKLGCGGCDNLLGGPTSGHESGLLTT